MSKKESKAEEQAEKQFDFETWEFNTLEDYAEWNRQAHRAFREAKKSNPKCDPPIPVRVPPDSFHKKVKVKFQRFDQPENILKARVRTKEIDWRGQLKPGGTYELPLPVVRFLNNLSTPVFAEVDVNDGGQTKKETQQVGERNRFSCHLLEIV